MIISASRRTDIPAYHAPWLMERLREGFAMVANPMNPHQVRRVDLRPGSPGCYQNGEGDIRLPRQAIPRLRHLSVERIGH